MKKIVVFGATGNAGAYFIDYCTAHLNRTEYEVVAVGRKDTSHFRSAGIPYYRVDIRNERDFDGLPADDVYAIVNFASLLPAYSSIYDPFAYIETNVKGALRILEYARRNKADRLLYTQTWAEMGGFWGKEAVLSPQMPRNLCFTGDHAFYTISKCMAVDMMENYHQEYGIKNFVFKLPNIYLYSPEKYYYVNCQKRLIAYRYMIDRAIAGDDIEMWGDPDAFKDIVYVKDLCQMMFKALFSDVDGGAYNVGTGIKTTLREQIEGMVKVFSPTGHPSRILVCPEKPTFTCFVMDIENAHQELGYTPQYQYIAYLEDYKREMEQNRFALLWGL
jgi:UDP-glucose 4-epimerase